MTAIEVRDLIDDELWQSTSTSAVGIEQFQKLDEIAGKLTDADERLDFKKICEQSLEEKDKNSIAIRYLLTITGKHPTDDRHILQLLEQYYEESKIEQTIFLAQKILSFRESSYVLKVLAECYSLSNMTEEKIQTWERLVKVDMEETEVLYKLADHYEKTGDNAGAISCYRSIIRRISSFVLKKFISNAGT
jgi:transcription elongation factor GreA-like protein